MLWQLKIFLYIPAALLGGEDKQSHIQNSNELVDFQTFSKSTLEICNKSLVVMEGNIQKTCEICNKQFASKYYSKRRVCTKCTLKRFMKKKRFQLRQLNKGIKEENLEIVTFKVICSYDIQEWPLHFRTF